ncbi:hypothetical protein HOG21_06145 [bacterium]|nr:hypothetical protein [bacterium]
MSKFILKLFSLRNLCGIIYVSGIKNHSSLSLTIFFAFFHISFSEKFLSKTRKIPQSKLSKRSRLVSCILVTDDLVFNKTTSIHIVSN